VYCNTGDWVEHCTALIEGNDGTLSLLQFYGNRASSVSKPRPRPMPAATRRLEPECGRIPLRSEREPIATRDESVEDDDIWRSNGSLVPA
jgi:hypothetical protein